MRINSPSEGTETKFVFEQSKGKQKYTSCNAPTKLCEKAVGLEAKIGEKFEAAGENDTQEVKFAKMIQFFIYSKYVGVAGANAARDADCRLQPRGLACMPRISPPPD